MDRQLSLQLEVAALNIVDGGQTGGLHRIAVEFQIYGAVHLHDPSGLEPLLNAMNEHLTVQFFLVVSKYEGRGQDGVQDIVMLSHL
jgi:hypothetical protein